MKIIANIFGVIAVALFVLSYQQKERKKIIVLNAASRVFYIIQYFLLSAFSGAVLDILGIAISFLAAKKENLKQRRLLGAVVIICNLSILFAGVIFYQNIFSIFSIFGIALHTNAFWMTKEKRIRIVSLLGSPCWLIYNITSHAFGSAIGDCLTIGSIIIAMVRHRAPKDVENEAVS